jgi:hypothetical protein
MCWEWCGTPFGHNENQRGDRKGEYDPRSSRSRRFGQGLHVLHVVRLRGLPCGFALRSHALGRSCPVQFRRGIPPCPLPLLRRNGGSGGRMSKKPSRRRKAPPAKRRRMIKHAHLISVSRSKAAPLSHGHCLDLALSCRTSAPPIGSLGWGPG